MDWNMKAHCVPISPTHTHTPVKLVLVKPALSWTGEIVQVVSEDLSFTPAEVM